MLPPGSRDHTAKVTGSLMYYVAGKAPQEETNDAFLVNIGAKPAPEETYAMRLGKFIEPFLIAEYERANNCTVTRRQEEVSLPQLPKESFATIDGFVTSQRLVTEFKYVAPFFSKDDILYRYYDQVALQMMCTDAERGVLVVGQGTNPPFEIECLRDTAYEAELLQRIHAWLLCVKTLTPPWPLPMPLAPPERWRTVDLSVEQTNWSSELQSILAVYAESKPYVEVHEAAGKDAKALIPDDVGTVLAGDYRLARNKNGIIVITRRAA